MIYISPRPVHSFAAYIHIHMHNTEYLLPARLRSVSYSAPLIRSIQLEEQTLFLIGVASYYRSYILYRSLTPLSLSHHLQCPFPGQRGTLSTTLPLPEALLHSLERGTVTRQSKAPVSIQNTNKSQINPIGRMAGPRGWYSLFGDESNVYWKTFWSVPFYH